MIHDSDTYRSPVRPWWRPRWRWLAFTIIDGREYRLDGWCWTHRGAERKQLEADAYIDRTEADHDREVTR